MFFYTSQTESTKAKKQLFYFQHLNFFLKKMSLIYTYLHEYFIHRGHLYFAISVLHSSHLKKMKFEMLHLQVNGTEKSFYTGEYWKRQTSEEKLSELFTSV